MTNIRPHIPRYQPGQVHLRIMATTDLHCHVFPYDYYADHPVGTFGLSLLARQIASLRANAPNSLLLDNGDFLQGSPLGDYAAEVKAALPEDVHPMIAAMNALRFDAATLGNHEFNYGVDFLSAAISKANFPVTSANVLTALAETPLDDRWFLSPYLLLDRMVSDQSGAEHQIRIGLIGFLPPQITIWDRDHLQGRILTRDIVASARALVPQMKAAGADLVVALCHSGIIQTGGNETMENAAVPLAALPGVDVVVSGHSHMVFPSPAFRGIAAVDATAGTIHGKPAVMAGCFGSHLGVIDLALERTASGWRAATSWSRAIPVDPPTEAERQACTPSGDLAVFAVSQADHRATLSHLRRPVGRTTVPLNSYFGVLPGNAALKVVAEAQRWHIERALRNTAYSHLPLLSATATFKMGGRAGPDHYTDVGPGELLLRHVSDLYAHPNAICAVKITGADLTEWLERSASVFHRLRPGIADQPLLNPDAPFSGFDVIAGVSYQIDLSHPPRYGPHGEGPDNDAGRISQLTHLGSPVVADAEFLVATNSYRGNGGSGFPGADGSTVIHSEATLNRDVLLQYITHHSPILVTEPANWQFSPMEGCSAIFETSARAAAHLNGFGALRVESAGEGSPGLSRFRIHF